MAYFLKNLCGCVYSPKGDMMIFATFEDKNNNRYIKIFMNINKHYDMIFEEKYLPHHLSIIYHYTKAKSCIQKWKDKQYLKGTNISQKYDVLLTIDKIDNDITDAVQENIFEGITCNNLIHEVDIFVHDLYSNMMKMKFDYDCCIVIKPKIKQYVFPDYELY